MKQDDRLHERQDPRPSGVIHEQKKGVGQAKDVSWVRALRVLGEPIARYGDREDASSPGRRRVLGRPIARYGYREDVSSPYRRRVMDQGMQRTREGKTRLR